MQYSFHRNEYYCIKCGLVVEGFNLQPAYEEDRGPFVYPWRANLSQTKPVDKWVGGRVKIIGMKTTRSED